MKTHSQTTDKSRVFFKPKIEILQNGDVFCPAGDIWITGQQYALPEFSFSPVVGKFKLYVEKVDSGADYLLDQTGYGIPVNFQSVGFLPVCWRDFKGDDIHVLSHVEVSFA